MRTNGPGPRELAGLALRLTRARLGAREGESLLWLAAVGAYGVVSLTALTVAAGTVMFYNRWQHPYGLVKEVLEADPSFLVIPKVYFILALVACALVVPSATNLIAGAAVLGARGRERRLASLRLLGLSSGDVTRMTLVDASIQAGLGTLVGLAGYWASHGLWRRLTMLGMPVTASEMWLPWWLLVLVPAVVVLLGLLSSWWGLQQVRISPLGVARRSTRRALGWWRLVGFVVIVGVAWLGWSRFDPKAASGTVLVAVAALVVLVQSVNLIGSWLLQQVSRALAHLPSPVLMWSARRVQADPRLTWKRVGGISVLALVGGFTSLSPIRLTSDGSGAIGSLTRAAQQDFSKGALIALLFALLLTSVSVFISQASAVLERAEQSRAMHRLGAPDSYSLKVMWLETVGPMGVSIVVGVGMGMALAYPVLQQAAAASLRTDLATGSTIMGGVLVVGLVLTVLALSACHPLQRRVLAVQQRVND
ncbi:MAG: ABC transporter permease [Actinomycetia bacterium]|nr:ABC transporter permease [Actinomycetes bacterium]